MAEEGAEIKYKTARDELGRVETKTETKSSEICTYPNFLALLLMKKLRSAKRDAEVPIIKMKE